MVAKKKMITDVKALTKKVLKVKRTSEGLRAAMFDELDRLINGKITPTRARASAALSGQVLDSVRLDLDFHRHYGKKKLNEILNAFSRKRLC